MAKRLFPIHPFAAFLLFTVLTVPAWAAGTFDAELGCWGAVATATHSSASATIPAIRYKKRGFYYYTRNTAYFVETPSVKPGFTLDLGRSTDALDYLSREKMILTTIARVRYLASYKKAHPELPFAAFTQALEACRKVDHSGIRWTVARVREELQVMASVASPAGPAATPAVAVAAKGPSSTGK